MEDVPPRISFRSAVGADLEYALDCFVKAFREEWEKEGVAPAEPDSTLRQSMRNLLSPKTGPLSKILGRTEDLPRDALIVLDEKGERMGCLVLAIRSGAEPRTVWIDLVYVEPEHRRKGVGRAIMTKAEEWARAKGALSMMLMVRSFNMDAIRLYESTGYAPRSIWMSKRLS